MNEKRLKQLNILVILSVIAAAVSIFLFVVKFSPENKNKLNYDSLRSYNKGWVLKEYRDSPDEIITLPERIKADDGEVLVLMNRVPEDVNPSSVIMFETKFQNVVVMVGDRQVYSNGVLNNQKLMKNAAPCYNVVEIGNAVPGEIISIYIVSAYKSYSGWLPAIYYGTRGDVSASIIRRHGAGFVSSITLFIITFILFVSVVTMKKVNIDKRKAIYAFSFIFAATIWSLLDNPILQLITNNVFGLYMADMVVLLLLPALYLLYQRSYVKKRRYARIFEIGIYIFLTNFVTGVIFQIMSVCDFASYMVFTKYLITISLVGLSFIMYLAADTYEDKTIYNNFWANIIITLSCLTEGILSYMPFYNAYDGVVLQLGMLLFIVLMVVTTEKQLIKQINKEKENITQGAELEKSVVLGKINTQFIYASLNKVINSLKATDKNNSRYIYDISIYMKHNMDVIKNQGKVPFDLELEYIKAYAGMARQQNPGIDIIIEDKVTDFVVPYNTVEPLVENAVINGAMLAGVNGKVVVRSYERLDCFAIQIVDNGPGIGPDKRFYGKQGYKAIRKRLKSMCGAVVEIKAKPDRGTILTIKIPKTGYVIKE